MTNQFLFTQLFEIKIDYAKNYKQSNHKRMHKQSNPSKC